MLGRAVAFVTKIFGVVFQHFACFGINTIDDMLASAAAASDDGRVTPGICVSHIVFSELIVIAESEAQFAFRRQLVNDREISSDSFEVIFQLRTGFNQKII